MSRQRLQRWSALLSLVAAFTACAGVGPRPGYVAQSNAAGLGRGSNLRLAPAVLFQDATGSTSYHAPTFADLPNHVEVRDVQGRSCESGLQVPWGILIQPNNPLVAGLSASVGWGDSGYQRALRDAANQVAPDAVLYDVRVDLQTVSVLSIWRQRCLVVTASAVTRLPDEFLPSDAATTPTGAPAGPTTTLGGTVVPNAELPATASGAGPASDGQSRHDVTRASDAGQTQGAPAAPHSSLAPVKTSLPGAAGPKKATRAAQADHEGGARANGSGRSSKAGPTPKKGAQSRTDVERVRQLVPAVSPLVPPVTTPSAVVPPGKSGGKNTAKTP